MTTPDPTLREGFRALWCEMRTPPSKPQTDAELGVQWSFLWRTVLAEMLTWKGIAIFIAMEAVAIAVTLLR